MNKPQGLILVALLVVLAVVFALTRQAGMASGQATAAAKPDYLRATYSPLHFKPAIATATDAQCLQCHREVLEDKVLEKSPAGVDAQSSVAWYQRLSTYKGAQDTFHRRHMSSDFAKQVMNLQCNTCHQGHDPRDEAQGTAVSSSTSPAQTDTAFTLRKQVNTEQTCLKCHGQFPSQNMGLSGSWEEQAKNFANSCTAACHATIRTNRHNVTYLKANAIEELGKNNADSCYGCHGGRAWYRTSYPYPRHPWPGMADTVPDWAKYRPTQSEARFLPQVAGRTFKP